MRIEIYVPTEDRNGRRFLDETHNGWVRGACELFSYLYGGCTVIQGEGFYKLSNGQMAREEVSVVYSYAIPSQSAMERIELFARNMCLNLNQEAVMVAFGDDAYFYASEKCE